MLLFLIFVFNLSGRKNLKCHIKIFHFKLKRLLNLKKQPYFFHFLYTSNHFGL
jgi:hypothetical protein